MLFAAYADMPTNLCTLPKEFRMFLCVTQNFRNKQEIIIFLNTPQRTRLGDKNAM